MFRLKEFQSHPHCMADLLPWAGLKAPGTVLNKTGELMACVRYRGPDLESSGKTEQLVLAARLNQALMHLPAGWALHAELSRGETSGYPPRRTEIPRMAAVIDDERRAAFQADETHYRSATTWTLSYKLPKATRQRLLGLLWEGIPLAQTRVEALTAYFEGEVTAWMRRLEDLCPEVRRLQEAELLQYLHYCATLKAHQVLMPQVPIYLDALLDSVDLTPGIRPQLGAYAFRCLSVKMLSRQTYPGLLAQLDTLPFPFRWVQRWIPLDRSAALRECKKYARIWTSQQQNLWTILKQECLGIASTQINEQAVQYAQEANDAQMLVANGDVALGYYTGTAVAWDTSATEAEERLEMLAHLFESSGTVIHLEDLNTVEAWLGTLPGHRYANVRRPLVHSMNLAHMLPTHALWPGIEYCAHLQGPALLVANTREQTPFHVSLHQGDVGDVLIIGPKGSGKSLLLATILLQWVARYPQAHVFAFELGQSLRIATQTAGGQWYNLGREGGVALQPLARIDELDERVWASEWLEILYANEGVTLTPSQKARLWDALTTLAAHEPHYRTLSSLHALLQDVDLREALLPYTLSGNYGGILDGETDQLAFGALQTFEMEGLLERPKIIPITLLALLHRIDLALTGDPAIIILDEAWVYLSILVFAERIKDWLNRLRKKNASILFATLNLADVLNSAVSATIAQECLTRILLPNARALEPEIASLYTRCGLTPRQIELIAMATPKRDYYFSSPQGARLFQLDHGPLAMQVVGSTTRKDLAQFEALCKENPADLAQAWMARKAG
jgi:type IV secretion/conjugal transfer VirB4 family ATPase